MTGLINLDHLAGHSDAIRSLRQLRATNGCFDVLHPGHVRFLQACNPAGERGNLLVVGLNSDESVRRLKGEGRPIINQYDRADMLLALRPVNAVCIFNDRTAEQFLRAVRPAIWYKGGDYTEETLDAGEREAVRLHGGRIIILARRDEYSTTKLVEAIARR